MLLDVVEHKSRIYDLFPMTKRADRGIVAIL